MLKKFPSHESLSHIIFVVFSPSFFYSFHFCSSFLPLWQRSLTLFNPFNLHLTLLSSPLSHGLRRYGFLSATSIHFSASTIGFARFFPIIPHLCFLFQDLFFTCLHNFSAHTVKWVGLYFPNFSLVQYCSVKCKPFAIWLCIFCLWGRNLSVLFMEYYNYIRFCGVSFVDWKRQKNQRGLLLICAKVVRFVDLYVKISPFLRFLWMCILEKL